MNDEYPTHPFLIDVAAAFDPLGGVPVETIRIGGSEKVNFVWNPRLDFGFLDYDEASASWGLSNPSPHVGDLSVWLSSDQRLGISDYGWSGEPNVKCILRSSGELPELLDFMMTARVEKIGTSAKVTRSLSSILEGSYLLIPNRQEERYELLDFHGPKLAKEHPEMMEWMERWFRDQWWCASESGFDDLGHFLEKRNLRAELPELEQVRPGDILFDQRGSFRQPWTIIDDEPGEYGLPPLFALRLKKDISMMWFSDYLDHASESENLITRFLHDWQSIPASFKDVMIEMPSTKRDQVAHSIELRCARLHYKEAIESLSSLREPFKEITSLYRKRTKAVEAVHGESLDDIQAIHQPLPFFIEYPFRHFRKEDDHVQKIRAGQRLLGILAKVPLFLVVEELLSVGHDLGSRVLEKLEERPPADGILVSLQKLVAKELSKLDASPLVMFPRLQAFMENTAHLDAMVTARNRMHHEPYDENGFLEVMSELAPQVVDSLRGALQGCRFIVPQHGRVLNGEKFITAEDACCSDAHFRTVDLKVTLPLEQFPSGELMVWTPAQEHALKLGKLLTSMLVTRQSRDFGIFDRMENQKRHFTFLRSE